MIGSPAPLRYAQNMTQKNEMAMKMIEYKGESGHFENGVWVPQFEMVRRSIGDDEQYIRDARLAETPGESLGRLFTIYKQLIIMEAEGNNQKGR